MNIITIDDEQSALNILTAAVKDVVPHAEIHAFRNPLDALEFMKKQRCEIVFLDIQMREMNGVVLARKLKEIYPKVNIVFVTGYAQYTGEAFGMHASGYVYKPVTPEKIKIEMENLRNPVQWKATDIYVKTFGRFELLVNGNVVSFGRDKSKEMLAYLVDRKGQSVTRKELAEVLFENTDYSRNTQNYLSKIIKELVTVLESVGAGDLLKRGLNSYAVDVNAFSCDFYDYESDSATASDINRFCGEYIKQYSWGEETLAKLYWKQKDME
ncbi:MAG: response regulator [Lachnospiraceae bacterium]|nr:response regulator [Lachnospiraceae bacterium]